MTTLRLYPKLRLAPLWPALAAILVAAALLAVFLPRLLARSAAELLQDSLDMLIPVVSAHLSENPPEEAEPLQRWVRQTAGQSDLRLTIVAPDGLVLADSARTDYQLGRMENHADRPEIRQAWATGRGGSVRRSDTTGVRYAYSARVIPGVGEGPWVLRLARPLDSLETLRRDLTVTLIGAVVAALLAILVISWWLDRRFFHPLALVIEGARELAAGHYGYRLGMPEEKELAGLARALNRLAGSVEEKLEVIRADRDHLKAILASMSEGVLVVDAEGRAASANPAFRRLFELEGEITGLLPLEISRRGELASIIGRTLGEERSLQTEIEIRTPERRNLALTTAALTSGAPPSARPGGGPSGAVVVARDTTESHRLSEMRRDFVANVSHELRTPLSAIRGYAETLRDGALDEAATARRFLGRILDQCRRLSALLDDLLILSRLESLEPPAEAHEPVDLASVVRRSLEMVTPRADEKGIRLRFEGEAPPIYGSAESLERLVLNLIENGVKYNRPGGQVQVRLSRVGGAAGGRDEVLLEVSDDGIGIPAEALPRIFERFYRVDKGRSREAGGTGLGLAIVKHVAQAHDGRVEVKSELGRGTTFRVRLPLGGDEADAAESA